MKLFIVACLIVCAQANSWGQAPVQLISRPAATLLSTGSSTSSRTQDSNGNYAFAYNEQHGDGGSSRAESGNGWASQGEYTLNVGDGRRRVVKYIADGAGFRAAIATNEPGTAALPAASTSIASPHAPPQPVQPLPVPVVAAPVAIAAPLALQAPIAIAAPEPIAIAAPAPIAIAPIVKAVPAVSSYSTSINHVAPAPVPIAIAAPALPALPIPAPVHIAAPVQLRGWN